jgi:hypothetical protein
MDKAPRSFDLSFDSNHDSIVLAQDSRAWIESFAQMVAVLQDPHHSQTATKP